MKKFFCLLLCLLIVFSLSSCSPEEEKNYYLSEISRIGDDVNVYTAGTYTAGYEKGNIPPGEYLIIDDAASYEFKDSPNELHVTSNRIIVTVEENRTIEVVKDARMYLYSDVPPFEPVDGIYPEGMYKVGKDIPAGTYQLRPSKKKYDGYYKLIKSSAPVSTYNPLKETIINRDISGETTIQLLDGKYFELSLCELIFETE